MKKFLIIPIIFILLLTSFSGCIDIITTKFEGSWISSDNDYKYVFTEEKTGIAYNKISNEWIEDYKFTYDTTSENWMYFQRNGSEEKYTREYYFIRGDQGLIIYEIGSPVLYIKEGENI